MSDSDRDKKLDELLEIIKRAPAMNGGFTKLQDAVGEIQDTNTKVLYELQLVKGNQDVHTKKIDELHTALYHPDQGLYRRVTSAFEVNDTQTAEIFEVKTKTDELSKKFDVFETKQAALEAVAGEDLKELRSTISTRKNMMRAFWAFMLAAIGGLAKFLWDVLPGLF
jgi:hypothetical protein